MAFIKRVAMYGTDNEIDAYIVKVSDDNGNDLQVSRKLPDQAATVFANELASITGFPVQQWKSAIRPVEEPV